MKFMEKMDREFIKQYCHEFFILVKFDNKRIDKE